MATSPLVVHSARLPAGRHIPRPTSRGFAGAPTIPRPVAILDRAIVRLLPAVPKPVVRRVSDRYVAGTELADAVQVAGTLGRLVPGRGNGHGS